MQIPFLWLHVVLASGWVWCMEVIGRKLRAEVTENVWLVLQPDSGGQKSLTCFSLMVSQSVGHNLATEQPSANCPSLIASQAVAVPLLRAQLLCPQSRIPLCFSSPRDRMVETPNIASPTLFTIPSYLFRLSQ